MPQRNEKQRNLLFTSTALASRAESAVNFNVSPPGYPRQIKVDTFLKLGAGS